MRMFSFPDCGQFSGIVHGSRVAILGIIASNNYIQNFTSMEDSLKIFLVSGKKFEVTGCKNCYSVHGRYYCIFTKSDRASKIFVCSPFLVLFLFIVFYFNKRRIFMFGVCFGFYIVMPLSDTGA